MGGRGDVTRNTGWWLCRSMLVLRPVFDVVSEGRQMLLASVLATGAILGSALLFSFKTVVRSISGTLLPTGRLTPSQTQSGQPPFDVALVALFLATQTACMLSIAVATRHPRWSRLCTVVPVCVLSFVLVVQLGLFYACFLLANTRLTPTLDGTSFGEQLGRWVPLI